MCVKSSHSVCHGVSCLHLVSWCVMSLPGVMCLQQLEALLPARVDVKLPTGENVMEVDLTDYEPNQHGSHDRREAYDEDEDEDHMGAGPRVQCAHQ